MCHGFFTLATPHKYALLRSAAEHPYMFSDDAVCLLND